MYHFKPTRFLFGAITATSYVTGGMASSTSYHYLTIEHPNLREHQHHLPPLLLPHLRLLQQLPNIHLRVLLVKFLDDF